MAQTTHETTKPTIQLTDNVLANISIMAPMLSRDDQNVVLGMIIGLYKGLPNKEQKGRLLTRK